MPWFILSGVSSHVFFLFHPWPLLLPLTYSSQEWLKTAEPENGNAWLWGRAGRIGRRDEWHQKAQAAWCQGQVRRGRKLLGEYSHEMLYGSFAKLASCGTHMLVQLVTLQLGAKEQRILPVFWRSTYWGILPCPLHVYYHLSATHERLFRSVSCSKQFSEPWRYSWYKAGELPRGWDS